MGSHQEDLRVHTRTIGKTFGASGATIAAIAAALPPGSPYKVILFFCAPIVAAGVSISWIMLCFYLVPYCYMKRAEGIARYKTRLLLLAIQNIESLSVERDTRGNRSEEMQREIDKAQLANTVWLTKEMETLGNR